MPGSAAIGNLAVNLTLETAAFQRGASIAEKRAETMGQRFSSASKSVAGLGAALGVGIGVAAIAGLAKSAFDMASALDESAQKMGVTVEGLQELNLAAEQSGVSQESLAGAMAKLNKNLGMLQQGSKPAVDAFAKIGLAAEDLKGKSPDQALRLIADALNKLPSVQERVAIGAQLMGRGFSELLPLINQGSAGLDHYAETSQRNGQITTDEAKKLDELADAWERMKVRAGVATAKVIAGMADYVEKSNAWLANWEHTRDGFIAGAENMASSVVSSISNMVSGISSAITGRLNAIWEGAKAKIESVRQKFAEMYDAVVGHSYVPDMVDGIGRSMTQLQRVMVDPSATAADKVGAIFQTLQGVIGRSFGSKTGGILDIIGQFAVALAPLLFGGAKGPSIPWNEQLPDVYPGIPGFASGGSGVFGGMGGVDRNVLSLNGSPIARVSRGENFSVGSAANSNGVTVYQTIAPNFAGNAATKEDLVRMAQITRSSTIQAIREERRRA